MLSRADWAERASNPSYVMPYYDAGNLFLTGERSDLTGWLEGIASSAPLEAARELGRVYGTGAGRLAPFADLLVVHELAHAWHDGVPFAFPRSWLMELFANMALYAYVAAEEPGRRLHFETLPRVALEHGLLKPVARDLRYFEALYPSIEPLTYVWYQFRFTMMAKGLVDAGGPDVLRRSGTRSPSRTSALPACSARSTRQRATGSPRGRREAVRSSVTGPRGGLLRQRNFRLFWAGESISAVGNSVTIVVIPLIAINTLHTSTFTVTLLTATVWLPWVIIGIPAGAWVDRLPPGPSCWPVTRSRWWCTPASPSPPGAGC